MRAWRNAWPAFVASLLLIWAVLGGVVRAQGSAGHLAVSTDYELFGTFDLRGGGHVTWTLTGDTAADLRRKILHLFDTYPTIPRGFPSAGTPTNRNPNGVLDAAEGVVYTNLLEGRLEAAGQGTRAQYVQLYPFDLRERGSTDAESFVRSTRGLANTTSSTAADVEIRFLFQANTTTLDARVPLATSVLVDSLYAGFSYRVAQSPSLAPSGPYPGSWPFLSEDGWHVVDATARPAYWGGRGAFWAGNDTTGGYDSNLDASSNTSMDPVLGSVNPTFHAFDFRYASRARATFSYTGTIGPGDALNLEYAHPPAYVDWTPLAFSTGAPLPPSTTSWSNVSVDLTPLLGDFARLRFHFRSDDTGAPSDLFVRDFALDAPAEYVGEVLESDSHFLIGTPSFTDPQISSGSIQLIRTPGGELLTYMATWDRSAPAEDTIAFRTFDFFENPQILFGVMLLASYGISRMQESAYDAHRDAQPAVYRPLVRRTKWLHRGGKAAMGVLILFYFVPSALGFVGLRIFVGGVAYWSLAVALALLVGLGTRAHYRGRLAQAETGPAEEAPLVRKVVLPALPAPMDVPDEAIGRCTRCLRELREGDPTYECTCGASYHAACATRLLRCSNCREPIAATVQRGRKPISLRCESCGEIQTISEGTDPRAATCPSCGGLLRHLDEGRRYLIVARDPAIAFAWMRDLTNAVRPALCFTSASPERLRLEFGIKSLATVQVSSTAAGALDPRKLDPLGLRSILPLVRGGRSGVILYDGVDEMIGEASLADLMRFLRKANDMAFVHGVTVIARIAPGRLPQDEVRRLRAEFDEYLDLSAQL